MAKFEIKEAKGSGVAIQIRFTERDKSIFRSVMWDPDEEAWSAKWQPRMVIMNWLKEAEEQKGRPGDHTVECLQHALFCPQTLSKDGLEILDEIERVTGLHSSQLDWILDEFYACEAITDSMIADSLPDVCRERLLVTIKVVRKPMLARSIQKISAYADVDFDLVPSGSQENGLIN